MMKLTPEEVLAQIEKEQVVVKTVEHWLDNALNAIEERGFSSFNDDAKATFINGYMIAMSNCYHANKMNDE